MRDTPDHGDLLYLDNDIVYLRAALKPFDPADRPTPKSSPHPVSAGEVDAYGRQDRARSSRARTTLLSAAAAAAVIVGATAIPVLLGSSGTTSTTAARPQTGVDYLDCQDRAERAGLRDGARSDPVAMDSSWPANPTLTTWYTATKRERLDAALRASLPRGACVFSSSGMGDLLFSDVASIQSAAGVGPQLTPQAVGRVVTPRGDGTLMAAVYRAPGGAESCRLKTDEGTPKGEEFTTADGTKISREAVSSNADDGTRWQVVVVQGARPDGSCVWLRLPDEVLRHDTAPTEEGILASGAIPLTIDELTALATAPGLDTSS